MIKFNLTVFSFFILTLTSFGQINQDFDKLIIEYSYYILNERVDYIVAHDSIIVKKFFGDRNSLYSHDSLEKEINKIFELELDSINQYYTCYDDGLITKFSFYLKGEKVKVSYLAGDEGEPLMYILNTLNAIMDDEDFIKTSDCSKWRKKN